MDELIEYGCLPYVPRAVSQQKGLEGVGREGSENDAQEGEKGSESLCDKRGRWSHARGCFRPLSKGDSET